MPVQSTERWLRQPFEFIERSRAQLAQSHEYAAELAERVGRSEDAARHQAAAASYRLAVSRSSRSAL